MPLTSATDSANVVCVDWCMCWFQICMGMLKPAFDNCGDWYVQSLQKEIDSWHEVEWYITIPVLLASFKGFLTWLSDGSRGWWTINFTFVNNTWCAYVKTYAHIYHTFIFLGFETSPDHKMIQIMLKTVIQEKRLHNVNVLVIMGLQWTTNMLTI